MVLSSLADAIISLSRITKFLLAEELVPELRVDPSQDNAVLVNGDFEWHTMDGGVQAVEQKEANDLMEEAKKKNEQTEHLGKDRKRRWKFWKEQEDISAVGIELASTSEATREDGRPSPGFEGKPFGLKDLQLEIRRGEFIAIVGRVGSGKVCIIPVAYYASPFTPQTELDPSSIDWRDEAYKGRGTCNSFVFHLIIFTHAFVR